MSSFLKKLKRKGVVEEDQVVGAPEQKSGMPAGITQLPVDVYQSDNEIIIFTQVPGTDISKLEVAIEGNNDIVTLKGSSMRPEDIAKVVINNNENENESASDGEFSLEECHWGSFFRQIILPEEVDADKGEAKIKDGVLMLKMPLKGSSGSKIKMQVVKVDEHHQEHNEHHHEG